MFKWVFVPVAASAITLRNLKMENDSSKIKITKTAHGLNDGDILLYKVNGGTPQTNMADNTAYAVADKTADTFTVKAVTNAEPPVAGAAIVGATINNTYQTTLQKMDSWAGINAAVASNSFSVSNDGAAAGAGNKTTWADGDQIAFVCTDSGGDKCNVTLPAAGTGVFIRDATAATDAASLKFKIAATAGAAASTINVHADVHGSKNGLYKVGSAAAWNPVTTTTKAPSWDTTNNKLIGTAASAAFADNDLVWYAASTPAGGLATNTIYSVFGEETALDKVTMQFKAVDASLAATGSALGITSAGSGGSLRKVTAAGGSHIKTTAIATSGDVTVGANASLAKDDEVRFYCTDNTAAKCSAKLGGFTQNTSYWAQAASTNTTVKLKTTKAGTAQATSTAVTAHTESIYLVKVGAAVNLVPAPAAGSGSAARGLAMFGSAVGVLAAMILA